MAHASIMTSQDTIYVFGGLQDKDRYSLKIERLKVSREGTWVEMNPQGIFRPDFPIAAVNYKAVQAESSFVIFGKGIRGSNLHQIVTIDEKQREDGKEFELIKG